MVIEIADVLEKKQELVFVCNYNYNDAVECFIFLSLFFKI